MAVNSLMYHCKYTGTPERGCITGAQVPLHTSITSNFLMYQEQFETNLLQLFAHT